MAKQVIDIGSSPNDGQGDTIRDSFDICNDNFTELYSYSPDTSLQADGSVDSTSLQKFLGGVEIGAYTDPANTTSILGIDDTSSISTIGHYRKSINVLSNISNDAIGTQMYGASLSVSSTGDSSFGAMVGLEFNLNNAGGGDHAAMTGIRSIVGTGLGSSGGSTGPLGIYTADTNMLGSGAFSAVYGYFSNDLGHANITTAYGMLIQKQTTSTNVAGIVLDGDDIGADIVFGAGQDISQHFNGTNLEFQGTGISHTGSTVTHDGYVTIAINGIAYNFMTGS